MIRIDLKRALSVFTIAFLFMSLLSGIPIVDADATLTSEFVMPVENWSFEERDYSIPGDGVFGSPPSWEANYDSWRSLPGDINGDGIVNEIDQDLYSAAYGSRPGDPNWNPDADISGDGFVDISDGCYISYYLGEEANRRDGSYSWYSGGGNYFLWQELDESVIPTIAGQTVVFGFWFLPHWVSPDGSENNARAEIYYEYTTPPPPPPPGGGGGCPFVSTWNGMDYVLDNNLLSASEASNGSDVTDYYTLQQPLVLDDDGICHLLLSEFENEHDFLDQVQLVAVDHSSDVNVAVSPYGEILTYTEPSPPVSAIDDNHRNVKHILSEIDGDYYEGHSGSYVVLNFGSELDVSEGAKLVMRADPPGDKEAWSIHVQIQDENHNWNTVAALLTREYWATEIIDLSGFLPDAKGNLKVRLYFTADHKIDFVGLDTSPQAGIKTQQAELVSAMHSKEGDPTVNGSAEGIEVGSRLLHDDDVYAELLPYEQIELAFAVPEGSINLTRDFVLVSKGHYSTLPEGTLIDPVAYGVWIAPTEQKWYNAYVKVDLPSTTTFVKVIIHGNPDFRAWIDSASLHIFDSTNQEGEYGSFNLGVNIFSYHQDPGMTLDGIVRLVPCVYAEAYNGTWPSGDVQEYKIHWIELKVTVIEGGVSDNLYIDHAGQENNEGWVVDPEAQEEMQEQAIFVTSILVSFMTGITLPYGIGAIAGSQAIGVVTRAAIGTTVGASSRHLLRYYASDPVQRSGTSVWEHWGYPSVSVPWEDNFVEAAGTHFDLNWFFDSDSWTDFEIYVESTICWASKIAHYEYGILVGYELFDEATWTQGLVVHIKA